MKPRAAAGNDKNPRLTAVDVGRIKRDELAIERFHRIWPLAGHGMQLRRAGTKPMSDVLRFRYSVMLHCRRDFPALPPMRKPTNKAGTCLSRVGHNSPQC
jgi:hypothetical protein